MSSHSMARLTTGKKSLAIGVVAAIAFTILCGINLNSQGMYYDEIHQAPAAFAYLGKKPVLFNRPKLGIPVMNMSYSGAIKSGIYGLYLKYVSPHFTVFSWRLLGILFVAGGLTLFYQKAGGWFPIASSLVFGALLMTDTSTLLMTRHDWGPVALSLSLRLAFLAVWISLESGGPTRLKFFLAGAIIGIAVFEKLSAVVLLVPLCALLLTVRKAAPRNWILSGLGIGAGSLPLLLVNLDSYRRGLGLISLSDVGATRVLRLQDNSSFIPSVENPITLNALDFAREYLALAQGVGARGLILGDYSSFSVRTEALVMLLILLVIAFASRKQRSNRWNLLAGFMAASYVLIGAALFLLPQVTSVHHWVLGTPFQYAAIAMALAGLQNTRLQKAAFTALLAILFIVRVPNVVAVEKSLASGKASAAFDPAFTRVAEVAASKSHDAAFVAADWGTATQVYCLGDGEEDLIYEPYWSPNPGGAVLDVAYATKKRTVYVLRTGRRAQFAEASAAILQAMRSSSDWQEVEIEKEFADIKPIEVRKFVRR